MLSYPLAFSHACSKLLVMVVVAFCRQSCILGVGLSPVNVMMSIVLRNLLYLEDLWHVLVVQDALNVSTCLATEL